MNTFDIIVLIPLLWGAIMGFRKGLILELASIAGLVLGIWGALKFSGQMGNFLVDYLDVSENLLNILSFILTFILIVIAVYLLAKLLDKSLKMVALGFLVRLSGAFFGIVKYTLILSVLLYVFESINKNWEFVDKASYQDAISYQAITSVNQPLNEWLDQLDVEKEVENIQEKVD